jgi:hypothetical protein
VYSGFSTGASFKTSTDIPKGLARCLSKGPTRVLPRGSTAFGATSGMILKQACGTNGGGYLNDQAHRRSTRREP